MQLKLCIALLVLWTLSAARASELIPPLAQIKPDHPRLLIRPQPTSRAISLTQLKAIPRDADFNAMLEQLKKQDNAAAQAMVWLLTQDSTAADKALRRMQAYRYPGKVDTFHTFFHLTEFGLAYDWLYTCPAFTPQIKAEVRANVAPLVRQGLRDSNDHLFHNYIWMSAGGVAQWAMATAGEDDASNAVFEQIRHRFNDGLYPAWQYLDGLPSEPMGYWALYVFSPGLHTLLSAQSAFDTDLVRAVREKQGGWLDRHFENLIHSTLPDMRYIPWGDLQSGPNGGVAQDMAGAIDAATWALNSPSGRHFSQWLATRRGLARFRADTAIFYMLYTRQLPPLPAAQPGSLPLSFLAGNRESGHFIARSAWDDAATVVAFTCTDHFGDHHHYDQGSFAIYRRGLLAVDPPVYNQVRGPQQKTENHNTLLIDGKPQRPVRGQWYVTLADFQNNLHAGPKLETGDLPFWHDAGPWAAVAGQFAQAYNCPELQSCVRQLLFLRPDKLVVVDRLVALPGKQVPQVQWLLQFPAPPREENDAFVASNGQSWLRCRSIFPIPVNRSVAATAVNTHCLSLAYASQPVLTLVHLLEVSDGERTNPPASLSVTENAAGIEITIAGSAFRFAATPPFTIAAKLRP